MTIDQIQSIGGLTTTIPKAALLPTTPTKFLITQTTEGLKTFYWVYTSVSPTQVSTRLKFSGDSSKSWETAHFIIDLPYEVQQYETSILEKVHTHS